MSRELTSGVQTAIGAKVVRPATLVFLDFAAGPVRMWSGRGDLVWAGDTYLGAGAFGGIAQIAETAKLAANGISLTLSGVPSDSVADAFTLQRGRTVRVWRAFFDDAASIIADPVQIFAGRIDTITISDSGDTSKITVTAESALIDLQRARDRRRTDEDQRLMQPGDTGFRFIAGLQNKTLPWGNIAAAHAAVK